MRLPTVVAFILALAVGTLCLVHGLGFMAGFNTAPLPALSTLAHETHGTNRNDAIGRVFVVLVDGLRADFAPRLALETPSAVPMAAQGPVAGFTSASFAGQPGPADQPS